MKKERTHLSTSGESLGVRCTHESSRWCLKQLTKLTSLGDLEPPSRNVGLHLKLICHLKGKAHYVTDKRQVEQNYKNKQ